MKTKHTVSFSIGAQNADLELCVFCNRMKDLSKPGECEHYAEEYEGGACSKFVRVDDVSQRLYDAVKVRSTT